MFIEYSTSPNLPNERDATCTDGDGPWFSSLAAAGTGSVTKMRISYQVPTTTESVRVSYHGFMGVQIDPTLTGATIPFWVSSSYDSGATWNYFDPTNPAFYFDYGSVNPAHQYYGYVNNYTYYVA